MIPAAVVDRAENALALAARRYADDLGSLGRDTLLEQIREAGHALVVDLFAPHPIESLTVIACLDEERVSRLDLESADDLVGVCCYIERTFDDATALGRYLRDTVIDFEAQRLLARTRHDVHLAMRCEESALVAEALADGVATMLSTFALPAGRVPLVRGFVSAVPR